MREVERIVLVYKGAEPNATELNEIVKAVDAMGFQTQGATLTTRGSSAGAGGPPVSKDLASFVLLRMVDEGLLQPNPLERATMHVIGTGDDAAVLAIVAKAGAAGASRQASSSGDQKRSRGLFGKRR
jgi:hypothetical protein